MGEKLSFALRQELRVLCKCAGRNVWHEGAEGNKKVEKTA